MNGREWEREWERRRLDSERAWTEIRRRFEQLERSAQASPEGENLAALWHRRALELAEAPDRDREAGEMLTLVILRLGGDRYAVPITAVREILRVGRVTPLSSAPAFVHGVVNLRGVVVAVLDLRVFFGIEPVQAGEEARIVVAESEGLAVGVLVERVEGIIDLPAAEVKPALSSTKGIAEDYVSGIATPGGQMVVLVDLEKVLRNPHIVVDEAV